MKVNEKDNASCELNKKAVQVNAVNFGLLKVTQTFNLGKSINSNWILNPSFVFAPTIQNGAATKRSPFFQESRLNFFSSFQYYIALPDDAKLTF